MKGWFEDEIRSGENRVGLERAGSEESRWRDEAGGEVER